MRTVTLGILPVVKTFTHLRCTTCGAVVEVDDTDFRKSQLRVLSPTSLPLVCPTKGCFTALHLVVDQKPATPRVKPVQAPGPVTDAAKLAKAFVDLLAYAERNTCLHEETHRGGAIWEICDNCGMRWADDKGGKPEDAHLWPAAISTAQEVMDMPFFKGLK